MADTSDSRGVVPVEEGSGENPSVPRRKLFAALVGGVVAGAVLFQSKAAQAAMAVIDATAIEKLVAQLNEAKKQVETLKIIYDVGKMAQEAIGVKGGSSRTASPWQSGTASSLTQGLMPDLSSVTMPKDAAQNFSTIQQATKFFDNFLFRQAIDPKEKGAKFFKFDDLGDITKRRKLALKEAVKSAMGFSASAKNTASALSDEARDIVAESAAAQDLRAQLAVTNRALASILQEMAVHRIGLAAIAENLGTQNAFKIESAFDAADMPLTKSNSQQ